MRIQRVLAIILSLTVIIASVPSRVWADSEEILDEQNAGSLLDDDAENDIIVVDNESSIPIDENAEMISVDLVLPSEDDVETATATFGIPEEVISDIDPNGLDYVKTGSEEEQTVENTQTNEVLIEPEQVVTNSEESEEEENTGLEPAENKEEELEKEMEEDKGPVVVEGVVEEQALESYTQNGDTNNEELFEGYLKNIVFGMTHARKGYSDTHLSGADAAIYSILLGYIREVAAGSRVSTKFVIPVENIYDRTSWSPEELNVVIEIELIDEATNTYGITQESFQAAKEAALAQVANTYNFELINRALLADCPYELYWYDKTQQVFFGGKSVSVRYDNEIQDFVIEIIGNETFWYPVASDYSAEEYTVDTSQVERAQTAARNAGTIIEVNAGLADYDKLLAYKNAICDLTSYNYYASENKPDENNPWQLVWVFDNDPETKVVCEGYSKAFQYLFDHSFFTNNLICYTVTGTMNGGTGAGAHMWNTVRMGNGKNYLLDVTNCDEGTVGSPDLLFLTGTAGSVGEGYVFHCNGSTVSFQYDEETRCFYNEDELVLASEKYAPGQAEEPSEHVLTKTDYVEATCGKNGNIEYWTCTACGKIFSDEECTDEITQEETIIPKTGEHTPAGKVIEHEVGATCTTNGHYDEVVYCSVCGKELDRTTQIIVSLGHSLRKNEAVPATTKENGNIEYYSCDTCHKLFSNADGSEEIVVEDTVIPMLYTGWKRIDNEWYFFNNAGIMVTNEWAKDSKGWCWMNADGRITKSKWIKSGNEWYYLKSNGYMAANEWAKDSGGWYWMGANGKITKSKWIQSGGEWYYLKSNGYMAANEWAKDSGGWYWMGANGKITKNKWIKSKSEWYYLKSNGYMAANEWAKDSGGWHWMNASGKIAKSLWIEYKGYTYFVNASGYMVTGQQSISGKTYLFNSNGTLRVE